MNGFLKGFVKGGGHNYGKLTIAVGEKIRSYEMNKKCILLH